MMSFLLILLIKKFPVDVDVQDSVPWVVLVRSSRPKMFYTRDSFLI